MAPALTSGLSGRASFSPLTVSIAMIELNGMPVAPTPIFSSTALAPISSITRASVNAFEIDWIEKRCLVSPRSMISPPDVTIATPNSLLSTLSSAGM